MSESDGSGYQRDACDHPDEELRLRTYSNGTTHYVMQCLRCGTERRKIKKTDPMILRLAEIPPAFDISLTKTYYDRKFAAIKERHSAQRAQEEAARREAYSAYLLSPGWRRKRAQRLQLDRGLCQARLSGCTERATEVHHLSYRHCGNEPMFDLASVCAACHDQITAMDHGEDEGDDRLAS